MLFRSLTQKEMSSRQKRTSHSVDAATPKRNHFAMAHTAKLDSKPNNSLWAESSARNEITADISGNYDVAIIGGGFRDYGLLTICYNTIRIYPFQFLKPSDVDLAQAVAMVVGPHRIIRFIGQR